MRRSATLGLWLALLLALAGGAAAGGAAAPRIAIEPRRFDFGTVLPRKTLHKEFLVRNFGAAELRIEAVSTSCGCTAALPERRVVAPGGSVVLRVSVETRDDRGRVRRRVLVRSNDSKTPVVEIVLEAEVRPEAPPPGKPGVDD